MNYLLSLLALSACAPGYDDSGAAFDTADALEVEASEMAEVEEPTCGEVVHSATCSGGVITQKFVGGCVNTYLDSSILLQRGTKFVALFDADDTNLKPCSTSTISSGASKLLASGVTLDRLCLDGTAVDIQIHYSVSSGTYSLVGKLFDSAETIESSTRTVSCPSGGASSGT